MGRNTGVILAVGVFVGVLAGGAMADILVGPLQSGQVLLSSVAQEFVPEGNWAGTDWQASDPVESDAKSSAISEESWMKEYGND